MARPERNTVDYFPHYISDGKKMFFIEHKYGNDGYSTWFKLLESLATTEYHYLDLKNESDIMFLSAKCRISENVLIEILNDLSKLGEIDLDLWVEKIVYSDKFIESIQDAYSRRNNKCMQKVDLCKHLITLCRLKSTFLSKKKDSNPQSKVDDTKPNDTIPDIDTRKINFSHTLQPFLEIYGKDLLNDFYKYWTEPNKSNTKFRMELEKTWSLERRLETWAKNDKNFNKTNNGITAQQTKLTASERLEKMQSDFNRRIDEAFENG